MFPAPRTTRPLPAHWLCFLCRLVCLPVAISAFLVFPTSSGIQPTCGAQAHIMLTAISSNPSSMVFTGSLFMLTPIRSSFSSLDIRPYYPNTIPLLPVCTTTEQLAASPTMSLGTSSIQSLKPGVHTNDFAPIYGRRAKKLGHASLTTVFRPSRLPFQPILRENQESPLLRYQPITTAVVTGACLNTRWHHGAYTSAASRESQGMDRVVTMYVVQSAQ